MNNKLILIALLGVGAFMAYKALKPKKSTFTGNSESSGGPAQWVQAGSQQDAMLAAQTAGM